MLLGAWRRNGNVLFLRPAMAARTAKEGMLGVPAADDRFEPHQTNPLATRT